MRRARGLVVDEVEIPELCPTVQCPVAANGDAHE
jgi:hypothetical protein